MGPHQIKARRRRWAIKASLPLSPTHDVYLSLCRARRASNGLLSRPLSLAHGGPPIRVGNDLQSCAAKWRFGSERGAGWLHHAIVNGYSTHTHMWVLDQTTKMVNEPFSNRGLSAFHAMRYVQSPMLQQPCAELLISFTCQCHSSALIVKYYT